MEDVNEMIKKFLTTGSGDGDGYGNGDGDDFGFGNGFGFGSGYGDGLGSGYGNGFGLGSGDGFGLGFGSGDGFGYGNGSNDGSGDDKGFSDNLISYNGQKVYYIDGIATVIQKTKNNLAKGYIINNDLTIKQCYIAKKDNLYAHGETIEQAQKSLQDKVFDNMDSDEKIEIFLSEFKPKEKYSAKVFFEWHNKLTGSCEFGRNSFIKNHGINLDDMYSVSEFINITKNDYGSEIIRQLGERWNERNS